MLLLKLSQLSMRILLGWLKIRLYIHHQLADNLNELYMYVYILFFW